MRRRMVSVLLALVLVPASSAPVLAVGTLDQEVLPNSFSDVRSDVVDIYQTFTAGLTGELDTVAVHGASNGIVPSWNVAIRAVAAGAPSGPNLATGSTPAAPMGLDDWAQITLTPALSVVAGTEYAIVAIAPSPWWSHSAAPYAAGTTNAGGDLAFRTFVTLPTPPTTLTHLVVTSRVSATQDGAGSESLSVAAGSTVYRTITIANGGTTTLGGLTLTDSAGALPPSCPALPASLGVGGSYTCTFSQIASAGTTSYTTTAVAGGETATGVVVVTGTTAATIPTIGSKLGLPTAPGGYTSSTKVAALNRYVTWQADFGAAGAGKTIGVHVATKGADGSWGPFASLTSRVADAAGVVRFSWRQADAAWLSVRFSLDGAGMTPSTQARWR
jgi:hypothetical protein